MPQTNLKERYLGNYLINPRSKYDAFHVLIEKMQSKLTGWKKNMLSIAGRLTLIKSVLSPQPNFSMANYLLPKKLCKEMNRIMRNFLWGFNEGNNHVYLKAWKMICRAKGSGGLGIRDVEEMNKACILKLCWRLLTEEDSLWAKVIKARYFPNCSLWQAGKGNHPTWTWQAIRSVRGQLQQGVISRIGNGNKTQILEDNWASPALTSWYQPLPLGISKVSDLMETNRLA